MTALFEIQVCLERIALLGDQEAFRDLFFYYYRKLKRFSFAIVKNREAAEEIAADVFVVLWRNRSRLHEIDNLNSYLYIATRNLSLRYISRTKNISNFSLDDIDLELVPVHEPSPEASLLNNELIKQLEKAIEQLPPRCRIIYKLVKQEGLKYKEVAAVLNLSVKTIDAQMAIAAKKINDQICFYFPEITGR